MKLTRMLEVIPVMLLRFKLCISLFQGTNGPWLYLTNSISKEEKDKDIIDYINPEVGEIQSGKYEEIAVKTVGYNYKTKDEAEKFDKKVLDTIDPEKVKQIVFICVDRSGSMSDPYNGDLNRFTASQKFFNKIHSSML